MKLRTILRKNRNNLPYLEMSTELVELLEWVVGDELSIETKNIWLYDKITKTCTLHNINKDTAAKLEHLLKQLDIENKAPNREE